MNLSLKLDERTKSKTKNGFPIIVSIYKDSKNRKEKGIKYYSFLKDWDKKRNNVKPSHPDYTFLFEYIEAFKAQTRLIENEARKKFLSIEQIIRRLFNESSGSFYKDGLKLHRDERQGGVNVSALNKFQKYFPDYSYNEITPFIVKKFMEICLSTQKNNGVHAYLRALTTAWNKLSDQENPFSGIRPKLESTPSKACSAADIYAIYNADFKPNKRSNKGGAYHFRNYFMLQILLGGIDSCDLANLSEDNFINGRVEFIRGKGGTNEFVNNKVFPEAAEILALYDYKPYAVPIFQYKRYKDYTDNFATRFPEHCKALNLSRRPLLKTPRYTFINMGKQLQIPENITMEIVGHKRRDVHAIYQEKFPEHVRDAAHQKIIHALLYQKEL